MASVQQRSGFPFFLALAALIGLATWFSRRSAARAPVAANAPVQRFSGNTPEAGIGPDQSTPLTEAEQALLRPVHGTPSLDALDIDLGPLVATSTSEAPDTTSTGLDVAEAVETPAAGPGSPDPTAEGLDLAGAGDDERVDGAYIPEPDATGCLIIYPIKGNRRSRIYHLPGDPEYASMRPGICFATRRDAEAAGYRQRKAN